MALKLVIGDVVAFRVKGAVNNGAAPFAFDFRVSANRLPIEEYRDVLSTDSGVKTRDFLMQNVLGWSGQRLVMDDGEPAAFSAEALALMLSVVGMEQAFLGAYLEALSVSDTTKGRSGN